tara:strand:- start:7094 stop:7363 length:270 start_codon:yes stop_codon:yes gene_type:complete
MIPIFGLFVLGQAIYKTMLPQIPVYETIGSIGMLALVANVSVLLAAIGVWLTGSGWPDILVVLTLAVIFLHTALFVLRAATDEPRGSNV